MVRWWKRTSRSTKRSKKGAYCTYRGIDKSCVIQVKHNDERGKTFDDMIFMVSFTLMGVVYIIS